MNLIHDIKKSGQGPGSASCKSNNFFPIHQFALHPIIKNLASLMSVTLPGPLPTLGEYENKL